MLVHAGARRRLLLLLECTLRVVPFLQPRVRARGQLGVHEPLGRHRRHQLRLHVVEAQALHVPHRVRKFHEARLRVVARQRRGVHKQWVPVVRQRRPRHELARLEAVLGAVRVRLAVDRNPVDRPTAFLSVFQRRRGVHGVEDVAQERRHVHVLPRRHHTLRRRLRAFVDPKRLDRVREAVCQRHLDTHLVRPPLRQRRVLELGWVVR